MINCEKNAVQTITIHPKTFNSFNLVSVSRLA